jgi:hypothetical protein
MAEYYFIDTRAGAKSKEPFAIFNKDVAKSWTRDFNNGEGYFKPLKGDVQQHEEPEEETEQPTVPDENPYKDMTNKELQDELDARGIDYVKKSTKETLINLLLEDDGN